MMEVGVSPSLSKEKTAVSIAVLPFRCLTPEAEPAGFTLGLLEDLSTELARYPSLEVIAPASITQAYREGQPELPFHAECIVQGSVRCAGSAIRINVQLLDAAHRRSLWAERYDAPREEIFFIEDEIIASIAHALHLSIENERLGQARRRPIASLEAYDCWLLGWESLRRGTLEDDLQARTYFQRAAELDPTWARAYAGLSLSYFNEWSCQAWHIFAENAAGAYDHARRAVELDDTDAFTHIVLARVYQHRRQFLEAETHFERALTLGPNQALTLAHSSIGFCLMGQHERALELASKAIRLHPLHEDFYFATLGVPLFHLNRLDEAERYLTKAGEAFLDLAAYRASTAALLGNAVRTQREREQFLSSFETKVTFGRAPDPGEPFEWLLEVNPYLRDEDTRRFANALDAAGISPKASAVFSGYPAQPRPAGLPSTGNVFRREGRLWRLAFCDTGALVGDLKGLHDIAQLLARPNAPVHCLELLGATLEPNQAGAVIDEKARRSYHNRVRELQVELEEAESRNDAGRAETVRLELDHLIDELSKALGLGGRSRKLGDPAERARSAVTWRIRSAMKSIQAAHPRLGAHLANAIRTGTFCVYTPEHEFTWQT